MKYEFIVGQYRNGRVMVRVYDLEGPFATLSTNVEDIVIEDNEFVLNHDLLHPMFKDFLGELLAMDAFEETGKTCDYGFCADVPIWRVDVTKL